jgi:hypothetical protein
MPAKPLVAAETISSRRSTVAVIQKETVGRHSPEIKERRGSLVIFKISPGNKCEFDALASGQG